MIIDQVHVVDVACVKTEDPPPIPLWQNALYDYPNVSAFAGLETRMS